MTRSEVLELMSLLRSQARVLLQIQEKLKTIESQIRLPDPDLEREKDKLCLGCHHNKSQCICPNAAAICFPKPPKHTSQYEM